jgi:hypothetical protein
LADLAEWAALADFALLQVLGVVPVQATLQKVTLQKQEHPDQAVLF